MEEIKEENFQSIIMKEQILTESNGTITTPPPLPLPLPLPPPPRRREDACFRCNLHSMISLETEIHASITPHHIQALSKTPFGNLFKCFYEKKIVRKEVIKSSDSIVSIMSMYSEDRDAFKIGEKWVRLSVDDVALIFGMPKKGKKVNPLPRNPKEGIESEFMRRRFCGVAQLNKKAIVDAIKKTVVLSGKKDCEDFARLVILYMAVTVFFSNSPGTIGWSFVQHIEEFNTMNIISWPDVILEYLMTQVRKHHKNPVHVGGCVILLLYWFCEHVDIISPFEGLESYVPRIARWSLHDLSKKMATISLGGIPNEKVSLELQGLSACERRLLDVAPVKENEFGNEERHDLSIIVAESPNGKESLELIDLSASERMQLDAVMEKKDEIENEKELDEIVWEKNKRLTMENIILRKRIKYLEKMVQQLQRIQDDNNSIDNDEMEDESKMTEEGENHIGQDEIDKQDRKEIELDISDEQEINVEQENQVIINRVAITPFLPPPESSSSHKKSLKTKRNEEHQDPDYEYNVTKRKFKKKKDENNVNQKETQQESSIDAGNFTSPKQALESIRLRDISSSSILLYLDEKQKHVVQNFFLNANKSTVAWAHKEKRLFITGSHLEDLMFEGFTDHQIMDWYALNLSRKLRNHARKALFFSALTWIFVRDGPEENEKHTLVDVINNMDENIEMLFFPMNGVTTSESKEDFHWTLLQFDCRSLEWTHYDSMLPGGEDQSNNCQVEAKNLQTRVVEVLNEANFRKNEEQCSKDTKLTVIQCPQQGRSADSALYICELMKKLVCGEEVLTESYSKEQMEKKQAKWAYKILSDPEKSWKSKVDQVKFFEVVVEYNLKDHMKT